MRWSAKPVTPGQFRAAPPTIERSKNASEKSRDKQMEIWSDREGLLQQKGCPKTRASYQIITTKEREESKVRLIKEGLFWRILVADDTMISKKRFLRFQSAVDYMDMQDRHGMPVEKYNRKAK